MSVSSASSWCPGALKGQLVATGTINGSANAQDVGPVAAVAGTGGQVITYSAIPLPGTAFPGGSVATPIPNGLVVVASDGVTNAGVAAGASVATAAAINGVFYTAPVNAGNWFSLGANQNSGSYQWWIYG
jgi:hypothetical protein